VFPAFAKKKGKRSWACLNPEVSLVVPRSVGKWHEALTMELIRFYALIIKIAIVLALAGQLKSCTLELMGLAAQKSERGMISYKQYTEMLTK
jgi:hypothetical protein